MLTTLLTIYFWFFSNTKCLFEVIYCKNYKAKIKILNYSKNGFSYNWTAKTTFWKRKNTFNYKYERQNKTVSTGVLLALFVGGFGIHKFWLSEIVPGVLYLLFCWTFIPSIIALIECFFMKNTVNNYNYRLAQDIFKEIEMLRQ